jgi:glutathione synthase/RimK-type ligase-like ATP-grasp enzyme
MEPYELPADLAARCTSLARSSGLDLAGIDLRITRDGDAFCFEVNPSPVYSHYESQTGQPIAAAIAALPRRRHVRSERHQLDRVSLVTIA